ncbi:hypothetical protein J4233_00365 [Candidatus Pacearchaeota archaeon]|nr:hypothetical protein [Candidatus Pacearchaeota archaeon]
MVTFKKSSVDVLDFTKLQKKGLLKVPERKAEQNVRVNSQGYIDLGISNLSNTTSPVQENTQSYSGSEGGSGASALGFLDSLASSASSSGSSVYSSQTSDSVELQGLKNKIEDLEYKMRVLEDKIAKIEGSGI